MQYFIHEKYSIAVNSGVGTNSITEAIALTRPDIREMISNGSLNPADNEHVFRPFIEQETGASKPVLILVRDVVDRFLSRVAVNGLDVDEVIAQLQAGKGEHAEHPWFFRQVDYIRGVKEYKAFRFPDQIEAFCKEAGFALPFPHRNKVTAPIPELSDLQREAVEACYPEDSAFFDSLK